MKKIKIISIIICVFLLVGLLSGCSKAGNEIDKFPEKNVTGVIMWGAGGATDNVSRALTPLVEKYLGKSIVLQNKPGATGAVATNFVNNQKSDGYTLLFGAENPQLYKVLDISNIDYDQYEPIIILGMSVAIVVVPRDSSYETFEDLIEDAKQKPGKIKMGSTGPGGLPFVASALIKSVNDVEFNLVPFDGEGPAMTAMIGGHVDVTIASISAARELYRAGKVKPLVAISKDPILGLEEIIPVTEIYSDYEKYLPWGPYYGIFAKKDTPKETLDKLKDVFKKGFDEQQYRDFLLDFGAMPLGYSGDKAIEFIDKSQKIATWLMYDAGKTIKSPEEFGIERIK